MTTPTAGMGRRHSSRCCGASLAVAGTGGRASPVWILVIVAVVYLRDGTARSSTGTASLPDCWPCQRSCWRLAGAIDRTDVLVTALLAVGAAGRLPLHPRACPRSLYDEAEKVSLLNV